jgi:hypothetical protein
MTNSLLEDSFRLMRHDMSSRRASPKAATAPALASVPSYYTIPSSSFRTAFQDYDPYDFERHKDYWRYEEPAFYGDYTRMWLSNPWAYLPAEYLVNEIFSHDFHFEGPSGAVKEVETFFDGDDTRHKLPVMVRQSVILGNGGGDVAIRSGEVLETRVLNFESIRCYLEEGTIKYTQDRRYIAADTYLASPTAKGIPLRAENIIHLKLKEWPSSPYGMSLFRPNLLLLMALDHSGQDIPAALKRIAYAPLLAKIDTEGFETDEDKDAAVAAWATKLKNVHSATTNIAMDKRHDLGIIGSLGGGGGGANLLPVMALLTPLISVVLSNFGYALGYFLQTGANRAILEEQKELADHMIDRFRGQIAHDLRRQLLSKLTDRPVSIVFDMDDRLWERKSVSMMRLYERGLVSKEFIHDTLDLQADKGTEFMDPAVVAKTPKLQLPAPTRVAGGE